jgi:hypothetical protein
MPTASPRFSSLWSSQHNYVRPMPTLKLQQNLRQNPRDGLKDTFGKEIGRDLIGRLHTQDLIATGPRSPRRGAPYTFVTTEKFLVAFDLQSLRDLPDREQLDDAGVGVIDE